VSACGVAEESSASFDPDRADDAQASTTLSPSYALDLSSRVRTRDRRDGSEAEVVTDATLVATLTQTGDDVAMSLELCSIDPPELGGHVATIKPSVIASLPLYQATGSIDSSSTPATLTIDDIEVRAGIDGNGAPVDQDRDGRDGVTIQVSSPIGTIDIFAGAILDASLVAPLERLDRISGQTQISLNFEVFGDSSFFVDVAGLAEEASANSEVIAEDHNLVMTALEAGSTCANQIQPPLPAFEGECKDGTGLEGDCCDAGGGPGSGTCIDVLSNSCEGGAVLSGLCPNGPATVKCCPH
jgi:hypothetical protein